MASQARFAKVPHEKGREDPPKDPRESPPKTKDGDKVSEKAREQPPRPITDPGPKDPSEGPHKTKDGDKPKEREAAELPFASARPEKPFEKPGDKTDKDKEKPGDKLDSWDKPDDKSRDKPGDKPDEKGPREQGALRTKASKDDKDSADKDPTEGPHKTKDSTKDSSDKGKDGDTPSARGELRHFIDATLRPRVGPTPADPSSAALLAVAAELRDRDESARLRKDARDTSA